MSDPRYDPLDTDTAFVGGDGADLQGLPGSLLGCFPNDPVSQVHIVDDWGHLDLVLPRDIFAVASGGSSGAPAAGTSPVAVSTSNIEASLDRRLDSIRREPAP